MQSPWVVTEIFAGFTPAGIAVDIKDLLQANTMQDRSLAVLGIVLPGLGDGVKALVKGNNALPIAEKTIAANGLKIESNTKHTLGQPGNRYDAGIEPQNSLELFNKSIPDPTNPSIRWAVDESGGIHRFSGKGGDGTFHWNGSTSDIRNPLAARREIIPQVFLNMAKMARKG
jgi:filamentous hemagglutinin